MATPTVPSQRPTGQTRALRPRLLALLLALAAPAHALDAHLDLGLDGAGGTRLAGGLGLPLPEGRHLALTGERRDNGTGDTWDRLHLSLEDDPAATLQQGAALTWEDAAGGLEGLGLESRLAVAGDAWVARAEGTLERLRLRLTRPVRPFTDDDFLELTALGLRLGLDHYRERWSLHLGHGRREHSRDLGFLARRPELALRLFTPSAVNAGYALEDQSWEAGLVHYRPRASLGLWWQRSRSAVDGATLDSLTLALSRGRAALDLGLTPALGAEGLFLRLGLRLGR